MSNKDLYDALTLVFREVFEDDNLVLTPELEAKDVPAWDSLNHIRLIVSIEEAFSISFSALEVSDLKKVADLIDLIVSKQSLLVT